VFERSGQYPFLEEAELFRKRVIAWLEKAKITE